MTKSIIKSSVFLLILSSLASCNPPVVKSVDYLLCYTDTITYESGYKNNKGELVIALGKYSKCLTDTFKTYAIVAKPNTGFLAIDRQEHVLYEVFMFDNGPDEPSDGLFRIIVNGKIGYADAISGKVLIKPQFDCAWPFNNGQAEVSNDCKTQLEGEHSVWQSNHWFVIDKSGNKIEPKKI